MHALEGRTIALLESRRGAELAALVRQNSRRHARLRAIKYQEVERPEDVSRFAGHLTAGRFDMVVFLTGAGVSALLDDALRRGVLADRGRAW